MTRDSPEPSQQGGRIQSCRTSGATEPSQWVRSHITRGGVRAFLNKEAGSGATGHMAASEPTLAGRQGPVLQGTWQRMVARPIPVLT
jgi:hypothetical protein